MDWAGLPVDLLIQFVVLLTVIDWLKFRSVCTTWRHATKLALGSGRRPKPEPPWLMLARRRTDRTTASFLSFSDDGRIRTAPLPEPAIQSRMWIGSAHGWVVTADEECSLHLLNPVTGAQLQLPCITTMGFFHALPRTENGRAVGFMFHDSAFLVVHRPEERASACPPDEIPIDRMPLRFLRKAVPLRNPSGSGEYFVMMIHGPKFKLVFARQRDARWVILPSPCQFDDAILYQGQFYTMTACGALLVWEPDGETFKSRVAVPEHDEGEEYVYFKKYLAESLDGDLVLIWREHRSSRGEDDSSASDDDDDYVEPDPTVRFQVFVLREGCQGSEWKELHDLGGAALFIGYNSAVFFPADGTEPNASIPKMHIQSLLQQSTTSLARVSFSPTWRT
ncbi:hypothetical protein HU200_047241 [Digitaria exilis]|uniref:KIB1-4 beta-propeller domain-containing protein n=1 Tax=Digitaria exilis TaxID=1010633 RepID=A0A835EDT4_9POAL|nr:hypothetical protein HU200_047241 [Digitaria exilis]